MDMKVFNAVTPFAPADVDDDVEQFVRESPLVVVVVVAKQSAGLPLDVMRDPA